MRRNRTALERAVSEASIKAVILHSPGLRNSIRDALDKGAKPFDILRLHGSRSPAYRSHPSTALAVDWIVDEWQRDNGQLGPDESIDEVDADELAALCDPRNLEGK